MSWNETQHRKRATSKQSPMSKTLASSLSGSCPEVSHPKESQHEVTHYRKRAFHLRLQPDFRLLKNVSSHPHPHVSKWWGWNCPCVLSKLFMETMILVTYTVYFKDAHSSQPSSSCSPAGRCSTFARCTRAWCPLGQPVISEGSWKPGCS